MDKKIKEYLMTHNGKAEADKIININQFLKIENGVVRGWDITLNQRDELRRILKNKPLTFMHIGGKGIHTIGPGAFSGGKHQLFGNIQLDESIRTIRCLACFNNQEIKSIYIPKKGTAIHNGAFDNCKIKNFWFNQMELKSFATTNYKWQNCLGNTTFDCLHSITPTDWGFQIDNDGSATIIFDVRTKELVIDYQNKEQKKALGYDSLFLVLHFFFNEKPEKVTIKNITLDMGGCTIKHNLKGVKIPLIFENVRWFIVPSTNFSQWDIQFINCKKIRTDKLDCSCLYPNLVDMEPENNNYWEDIFEVLDKTKVPGIEEQFMADLNKNLGSKHE